MFIYFLSNLNMGGGGTLTPIVLHLEPWATIEWIQPQA